MRVVVNAAVSADGKLSTRRREQVRISGPDDFDRVDRLRADCDAVMVGIGTVLADDPGLTVDDPDLRAEREDEGKSANPARVVADSRARTPADAAVLDDDAHTYLLASRAADEEGLNALAESTVDVVVAGDERVDLPAALEELSARGVDRLMVEGGGELLFSLFEDGLVDDLYTFVGPQVIGGRDAPTLVDGGGFVEEFPALELQSVERLDGGALLRWSVDGWTPADIDGE